jgi:hypothetical protein
MKIRLIETLASGAPYVAPMLVRRLASLDKDPSGSHALSALGATVKIALGAGEVVGEPPDGAWITLQALAGAAIFPVFHGTLRVEPVDAFSSRLVLAGHYSVPLGTIGSVADRTILAGAAKRSLRALLGEIRAEVAASVLRGTAEPFAFATARAKHSASSAQ